MTQPTKPRIVSMTREDHTNHYRLSDGQKVSARIDWTIDDARDGLVSEFIEQAHVIDTPRAIRDADGKPIAWLVTHDELEEGHDAIHRINEDSYGRADQTYTPFVHHPSGNPERLINVDALENVIRRLVHGKTAEPADLTKGENDLIHYAAIGAAIEFGFEPDSRGLVPVLTPARAMDGQFTEYLWSFLYPTPVAGLYLRAEDHIVGTIEYALTTGSGYTVVRGFWERDYADELAVKLGEALPGINWFTARNGDDLTTDIKTTMRDIIRAHGFWRKETPA